MPTWQQDWLIGSKGLYHGVIGGAWTRVGSLESGISSLLREPERLVAGACQGSGLWEWPHQAGYWKQLHDETLTEVMAVASIDGNPGVVAGSSFSISTGRRDDTGAVRWTHLSDMLNVNERFTNAIQIDPADSSRWLIGTEAGVLIAQDGGARLAQCRWVDLERRRTFEGRGGYIRSGCLQWFYGRSDRTWSDGRRRIRLLASIRSTDAMRGCSCTS